MNLRKLTILFSIAALATACQNAPAPPASRAAFVDEPTVGPMLPTQATPSEAARVVKTVPLSKPNDYLVSNQSVRVMAIEPGDDEGRFAVVSDTANWSTKNLRAGDTFGRGFTVRAIEENAVVFADARGAETRVPLATDTTLTRIDHKFDRTVRYEGRGKFTLSSALAKEVLEARGTGATFEAVDGLSEPGVRATVTDATLASALGLKTGDVILTIDGEKATAANAGDLLARTAQANASTPVVIRAYRQGSLFTWVYNPR